MLRRTLTVLSLLGLVLSLTMWGVSYFRFRCFTKSYVIDIAAGRIKIVADSNPPDAILAFSLNFGSVEGARAFDEYAERLKDMMKRGRRWMFQGYADFTTGWKPQASRFPFMLAIPLWMPTLIFVIHPLYSIRRSKYRRRRRKLGLCVACGYDLRGSPGKCPECGDESSLGVDASNKVSSQPREPM